MSPLLQHAADMGISEDGSMDDCHSPNDTEMCNLGHTNHSTDQDIAASIVYVSVLDPMGEPTFRPSKTKPLPKWMNLLPSNVHRDRERRAKTAAEVTNHSQEMESMREIRPSHASAGSDDFDIDTPVPGSRAVSPTGNAKKRTAPSMISIPQKIQKRATIAFDPTPRRDTEEDASCKSAGRSQTSDSICSASPQHPCSHPSRPQTPYPRSPFPKRPSIVRNETTSYFSHRSSVAEADEFMNERCYSLDALQGSPDSSQTISPIRVFLSNPEPLIDFSSPSQSSEYLERYQPKKTPAANFEKYVASEPEPILEKIKKQKAAVKDDAETSNEKMMDANGKGRSVMLVDEEYGLDPRREDLNKELRNLFCEE